MKHPLIAGLVGGVLLLSGCQTLNSTAKNKSPSGGSVAQAENVREVPWTWRKKKTPDSTAELPPEFAQKLEDAKRRAASPKTADEWIAEGSEQEVSRNFSAANKAYDEALRIDPVNATAHHRLAILADMRQEYGIAQDHYEAALRQKPRDPNLLSDLGYSHHLRGNAQQSKRHLLQALDIERQHKQALKNLGTLYASQGWYDDAVLAFRHYRTEAEAQQLVSDYFPKGRPMPDPGGEIALAGSQRTAPPMPPDVADPDALQKLSLQEVAQLMERQRQAAIQEREQKQLVDLRSSLQPSASQDSFAATQPPPAVGRNPNLETPSSPVRSPGWDQNSLSSNTNRSFPPASDPFAHRPAEGNANSANPGPVPSNETPFWSGAGTQPRQVEQAPPPPNWPSAPQGNFAGSPGTNTLPPANGMNPNASPSQAPWWADGSSQHDMTSPGRPVAQTSPGNLPNGLRTNDFSASPGNQPAPSRGNVRNNSPQTLSQQAYQLGMSAGPGTMFPMVPGNSTSAVTTQSPGPNGGQWSNSTAPGGYTEMKPSAGWDQLTGSAENPQWRDAPSDTAPRSPTDNWNPPTSVPWPGDTSSRPSSSGGSSTRTSAQPLPAITPGLSPWGNAAAGAQRGGKSTGRTASDFERGSEAGSGVVPAWFDSRTSDQSSATRSSGPSSNATTVPQWPYAPK